MDTLLTSKPVPNMMMISMVVDNNTSYHHNHNLQEEPSKENGVVMMTMGSSNDEDSNEALSPMPSPLSSPGANLEDQERKQFMMDLHKFMGEMGKPLSKVPIMGYKELDLFQLFREVVSYGGFNEVVKNVGTWSKIWKRLDNFDPSITDSSFRLKKNYERYLLDYEFKTYPDFRRNSSSDSSSSTTTKPNPLKRSASHNSISLSSIPLNNNNNNNNNNFGANETRPSKTPKAKKPSSKNRSSLSSSTDSIPSNSLLNSKEIPADDSADVSGPSTGLTTSTSFDSSWNELPYYGRSQRSVKKRKINYSVGSSSEDEDYDDQNDYYPNQSAASSNPPSSSKQTPSKSKSHPYSSEEDSSSSLSFTDNLFVNMSRDEIDALENAVLTLSTLKYCSAY